MADIFTAAPRLDARMRGPRSGAAARNVSACGTGFQIGKVRGAAVGQLVVAEITPNVLARFELGRIGRETLDLDGAVDGQGFAQILRLHDGAFSCFYFNESEEVGQPHLR